MSNGETTTEFRRQSPYFGKMLLAPMVRVNHLGFRAFTAQQGVDMVFTEELIAIKLAKCTREVVPYPSLGGRQVVEFVTYELFKNMRKRAVVFATPLKKSKEDYPEGAPLVLQLGASDPEVAGRAAALVANDVDGFDVNMGCPKKFSVDNGMGAALMCDPDRAANILVKINEAANSAAAVESRGYRIPISFKTRLFDDVEASMKQLSTIFDTGVPHALTLHARTRPQRSETAPLYDRAAAVVVALREKYGANCPCLVLNGDVHYRRDGFEKATRLGFDAFMSARGAMRNPTSVADASKPGAPATAEMRFEKVLPESKDEEKQQVCDVFLRMMRVQRDHRTPYQYVKYHLTRSLQEFPFAKGAIHRGLQASKGYYDAAIALGLDEAEAKAEFGGVDFEPELLPIEEEPAADSNRTEDDLNKKRTRFEVVNAN